LMVTWQDGHVSHYPNIFLTCQSFPASESQAERKFLWNGDKIRNEKLPVVDYQSLMSSTEGLKTLLASLLKYGFGCVGGTPVSLEGTQQVAERVCHVETTLFGKMWSFTSDLAHGDTAYTNLGLGPHTDNAYFSVPAGIQVFHKMYHDGQGGETLLVDGFNAVQQLRDNHPESFDILCRYRVEHEYEEFQPCHRHVVSLAPILQTHPVTGVLEWIRYNHYDRTPIRTVPTDQIPAYYQALRDLSHYVEAVDAKHWLSLEPGTVLFVDNWRVLHGRSAFSGKRQMGGCYLPRDDWIGRARTLSLLV